MTEAFQATPTTAALAAAVAAAAEIAKNNEEFFCGNGGNSCEGTAEIPMGLVADPDIMVDCSHVVEEQDSSSTSSSYVKQVQCTGEDAASEDKRSMTVSVDEACGEKTFEAGEVEGEEDAKKRLARSRERNREHARRTRLRKKAQLAALQSKVKGLEAESRVLKQSMEECSIASILVGLSSTPDKRQGVDAIMNMLDNASTSIDGSVNKLSFLSGGKRKRFVSVDSSEEKTPLPLKLKIDGETTLIGGSCKSHINWKTGIYSDESGVQRQLSSEQLESLRRERNRMHAKMTRDRKKNFIATIEKNIEELEADNQKMKDILCKVAHKHFGTTVTPPSMKHESEEESDAPGSLVDENDAAVDNEELQTDRDEKRCRREVTHGFFLESRFLDSTF